MKNPFVEYYPEKQARPGSRDKLSLSSGMLMVPTSNTVNNVIENIESTGAELADNVWVEEFEDDSVVIETMDNMTLKLLVHPDSLVGRKSTGGVVSLKRNHGDSTGTGAEQTIPHGLGTTPSYVCLTEYNTGGALAYESSPADTINIYITATLNKTYRWSVEDR